MDTEEMKQNLAAFLSARMDGAEQVSIRTLERLAGGASRENWSVDAEWLDGGRKTAHRLILRRDPPASLLETDRRTECCVLRALECSAVPVPKVCWVEHDGRWLERPFCLMERAEGMSVWRLLHSAGRDRRREDFARHFATVLARIHGLDWRAMGLSALDVPGDGLDAADRQIRHWESVMRERLMRPEPVLTESLIWLKAHKPETERISLVHGDYRSGNCLFSADGVAAVLDWEMAHLGDPIEDVAWVCMKEWAHGELVNWLTERARFIEYYESAGGARVGPAPLQFYEVLANVKLAVIYLTGAASFRCRRSHDLILARAAGRVPSILKELIRLIGL